MTLILKLLFIMQRFGKNLSMERVTPDKELSKKFMKGMQLAIDRLIEKTAKEDGELAIMRDGKVVRVKARDLR